MAPGLPEEDWQTISIRRCDHGRRGDNRRTGGRGNTSPERPNRGVIDSKKGETEWTLFCRRSGHHKGGRAPTGTRFTGWKGDVQILADPRSPATTAMVPFTPVTVTATYSDDSQDPAALTAGATVTSARDEGAEIGMDDFKHDAPGDRADRDAGTKGAGHSLRAPVTGEIFYFVMADRFENGSTANDLAGLPDDRMVSGFDPTARGFYHGGDLRGIINRLDYVKALGTTAIWLTPSFKNRPVQPQDGSAGYHGYGSQISPKLTPTWGPTPSWPS